MAKRSGNLKREEIKEEMVLIEGSFTDYITPSGKIYKLYYNGLYMEKKGKPNIRNGYVYIGITMADGKNKHCRVHRLVAKAFIPNPNNYEVVGHQNNIKHDNRVENLYWTTIQENTKKAFDDGLAKNAKGYEDSQSNPVVAIDKEGREMRFGSARQCSEHLGISISTIMRQCKGETKTKPRCNYTFKFQN